MLTLLLHLVFRTFYYYSTLLQVQHVGVLIGDTLYIPCNCYVGMSTACGHACTRYEVYKVRAIYCYLNFVVSSSPGTIIFSRRCIVYGSGTLISSCRCTLINRNQDPTLTDDVSQRAGSRGVDIVDQDPTPLAATAI